MFSINLQLIYELLLLDVFLSKSVRKLICHMFFIQHIVIKFRYKYFLQIYFSFYCKTQSGIKNLLLNPTLACSNIFLNYVRIRTEHPLVSFLNKSQFSDKAIYCLEVALKRRSPSSWKPSLLWNRSFPLERKLQIQVALTSQFVVVWRHTEHTHSAMDE